MGRYGIPKSILSDNGMEFAGRIYTDMMRHLGVKRLTSAPYYPRSNGMVERLNGTLQDMIKSAVRETNKGWVDILPFVTATYRAARHETTGYTPNMMVLGRELPLTADIMLGNTDLDERCPMAYTAWLQHSLLNIKGIARTQIAAKQVIHKRNHDKKLKPREVHVNDLVLRLRPVRKKLQSKWIGPYRVIEITGRTVMIQDDNGTKRADISQLRVYRLSEVAADTIFLQHPAESDSSSDTDDENRTVPMTWSEYEREPNERYFPEKPSLDDARMNDLSDSESDSDQTEENDGLDISLDGQVGRGFTHDDRQEMLTTTTRSGRTSKPPARLIASTLSCATCTTSPVIRNSVPDITLKYTVTPPSIHRLLRAVNKSRDKTGD